MLKFAQEHTGNTDKKITLDERYHKSSNQFFYGMIFFWWETKNI